VKRLPKAQKKFLNDRLSLEASVEPRWIVLNDKLLALGGQAIVAYPPYHFSDRLPNALSRRARSFDPQGAVMLGGQPGHCHHNTAAMFAKKELWRFAGRSDLPKIKIVTGWALSDDGIWRSHSWGVQRDGTVVETTCPRIGYFGVVLNPEESNLLVRRTARLASRGR
jgi:hypothetical protein